jgi:hypothetical protein
MLPAEVARAVERYLGAVRRAAGGELAAAYAVGGAALNDFSSRQSNVDLVVVCDPALTSEQVDRLRRAERGLDRVGRRAAVWHTSWAEIAGLDGPRVASAPSPLATPLTRALLRQDPMALAGPDWPVVDYDQEEYKRWCSIRLRELAASKKGPLLMRRALTPVVLEAARLAQGAITGRVFSKAEAGESVAPVVSSRYRRILTDTVGYRRGAQTSMYWGPFERKYDALILIRDLVQATEVDRHL